jgi:signal transduction histidine kinase
VIRPTVRLRLTAWYASIFLLGGAVLLAISYAIVSRNTTSFPTRVGERLRAEGAVTRVVVRPPARPPPTLRITGPDRQTLLRLERARQAAERQVTADIHRQTAIDFALALIGTTLISLLAGWIVAGRALRPVARITTTARRVAAEGDLAERIALDGPADELRELADTFDVMLERLDRTFASQKSFVANASHELRTPLAIIRAEIEERLDDPSSCESDLRAMATVVHDAVARSEALITSLLTLARGQDTLRRRERVDLAELSRAVADRCEPEAAERGISIEVTGLPAHCPGDPELLEHLVDNLVENAVRYNHRGGFVRVEAEQTHHGVTLRVSNSGEVVPAEAVPQLFEPFVRVESSRSRDSGGAGLGLSIVAAVAATHGGTASAAAREGGGLVVTVTLPASGETLAAEGSAFRRPKRIEEPEPEAETVLSGERQSMSVQRGRVPKPGRRRLRSNRA